MLPPVTLLFRPLLVEDMLRIDIVFAPFLAAIAIEENGLEDVG